LPAAEGFDYLPLPNRVWRTKCFEFWVFLGALLHRARPRSLLELGSGRSTIYLSEYASKCNAALVSVEQNPAWAALGNTICRFGGMSERYVHHVPLGPDGFYPVDRIRQLLPSMPDMLYLDGPNRDRSGMVRHEYMLGLCRTATIIVLDDVQRQSVYDQMQLIATASGPRESLYFRYRVTKRFDNYVAVLMAPTAQRVAQDIVAFLGLPALESLSRESCVEQ
jgi:predicted O-methyltransferase YrrM